MASWGPKGKIETLSGTWQRARVADVLPEPREQDQQRNRLRVYTGRGDVALEQGRVSDWGTRGRNPGCRSIRAIIRHRFASCTRQNKVRARASLASPRLFRSQNFTAQPRPRLVPCRWRAWIFPGTALRQHGSARFRCKTRFRRLTLLRQKGKYGADEVPGGPQGVHRHQNPIILAFHTDFGA